MPIPPDAFFLDRSPERGAGLPLQVQLRRQIIAAVTAGRFRAGEKLPSTRALADHLGVARAAFCGSSEARSARKAPRSVAASARER